ncbi:MAG: CsgG/HfaB family protein, partial [Gemmatimonadetes bacterium]|nr:CsgG/HfaB family protein [Gemmatimonadota bacterium]
MLRRFVSTLVLAPLVLLPLQVVGQAEPDTRPGIAVMQFENAGSHGANAEAENFAALEIGLQVILGTELGQNAALRLVERDDLQALLREQELATEGRVDASTAADIGRLVGARYMVMGSFVDIFEQVRMDARVVDVETGELLRARGVQDRREEIYS